MRRVMAPKTCKPASLKPASLLERSGRPNGWLHDFVEPSVICEVAGDGHRNLKFNLFNGVRGFRTYIGCKRIQRSSEIFDGVSHVEHRSKDRFGMSRGLGLARCLICARWSRRPGRNGRPTKRWCNCRHAKSVDRPERNQKLFQGGPDTAAAHKRPDDSAVQVIGKRTRDGVAKTELPK